MLFYLSKYNICIFKKKSFKGPDKLIMLFVDRLSHANCFSYIPLKVSANAKW